MLSSVYVAEWPPFGKELLTRLTICSLCIMSICNFSKITQTCPYNILQYFTDVKMVIFILKNVRFYLFLLKT